MYNKSNLNLERFLEYIDSQIKQAPMTNLRNGKWVYKTSTEVMTALSISKSVLRTIIKNLKNMNILSTVCLKAGKGLWYSINYDAVCQVGIILLPPVVTPGDNNM